MTQTTPRWCRPALLLLLAIPPVWFTGCATTAPGIVLTSPNVYTVTVQEKSGMFANDKVDLKGRAIGQAMDFAEAKGKVAVPVNIEQHEYGIFGDWVKIEYQFKLVNKSDPQARQTSANQGRDEVPIDYDRLHKLEDLRKKGVLTQAEFEREKAKLLAQPK